MLIYIIGAIFLFGILIALLKGNFQEGTGIDGEQVLIKAGEVQRYSAQLERGVAYVLQQGISESDMRFAANAASAGLYGAYSNTNTQVFAPSGGGVEYKAPPSGINNGTAWQFYGNTHFTDMGTDTVGSQRAELTAVLPNVTEAFCNQINRLVGQKIDLTQTTDPATNGCVYQGGAGFTGTFLSGASVNLLDDTKLSFKPATEACVRCSTGTYNYYRVLMSR